ncbi:MAG: hypothetical protein AAGA39_00800 [Pseudomonadota bacterium]
MNENDRVLAIRLVDGGLEGATGEVAAGEPPVQVFRDRSVDKTPVHFPLEGDDDITEFDGKPRVQRFDINKRSQELKFKARFGDREYHFVGRRFFRHDGNVYEEVRLCFVRVFEWYRGERRLILDTGRRRTKSR